MSPTPVNYGALKSEDILVKLDGGVLIVTVNRPKRHNTFAGKMPHELIEVFGIADRDDNVRVVIVTADPSAPAYCAGADISAGWGTIFNDPDSAKDEAAHRDGGGQVSLAIYKCRKITIAAVNGHAAGVGMTAMQLPFDFRFVWSGAKLTFPFVRRGIAAEATSSYLLPRLLGHAKANALLLTGHTVKPDSPHIQGLYYASYPTREEVFPAALALAKDLAKNTSQPAVTYTKGLFQHPGDSIEENHLIDSRIIRHLSASKDAAEGAKSFMERRDPKFEGTNSGELGSFYPWWRTVDLRHHKAKL